ncbi:MAG: hypothetical protein M3N07_10430, partial [Pseudomonadota bacterium]|nr:hypothetical protein [Pseudomonadota bacterium]
MASASVDVGGTRSAGALLAARLDAQGSAAHRWFGGDALRHGPDAPRNLADAVHFLCSLHGRHPGVVDLAAERATDPQARGWLARAAEAFAAERSFLTRLAVAAGPL